LLYLKEWIEAHPDARSLGLPFHIHRLPRMWAEFAAGPLDPPPWLSAEKMKNLRVGPRPGYFAVDLESLTGQPYRYFERFQPIAKAGNSIFIYHITAEQARREMGLPPLVVKPSP
jgi:hypothetical protein